jgi:hypothetical protein
MDCQHEKWATDANTDAEDALGIQQAGAYCVLSKHKPLSRELDLLVRLHGLERNRPDGHSILHQVSLQAGGSEYFLWQVDPRIQHDVLQLLGGVDGLHKRDAVSPLSCLIAKCGCRPRCIESSMIGQTQYDSTTTALQGAKSAAAWAGEPRPMLEL